MAMGAQLPLSVSIPLPGVSCSNPPILACRKLRVKSIPDAAATDAVAAAFTIPLIRWRLH